MGIKIWRKKIIIHTYIDKWIYSHNDSISIFSEYYKFFFVNSSLYTNITLFN